MKQTIRGRAWVESTLAFLAFGLGVLTVFWRDWIEALFHVDLDRHSGMAEWAVVGCLFAASLVIGLHAARQWRRSGGTRTATELTGP